MWRRAWRSGRPAGGRTGRTNRLSAVLRGARAAALHDASSAAHILRGSPPAGSVASAIEPPTWFSRLRDERGCRLRAASCGRPERVRQSSETSSIRFH